MSNSPISRWDVRVVEATTLEIRAYIPRWTSLEFSDQLSDVGSGKITLDYNDQFIEQFDLQYGNGVLFDGTHAIQILRDGVLAFTFIVEDVDVQRTGYAQETVIAGRGIGAQLDWAIVLPENYSSSMSQVSLETAGQQLLARELKGYEFLVRVASTANLASNYSIDSANTGTLTASSNGVFPTVDGVLDIVVTDTILLKNQTNTAHNGVYTVDDYGSVSTPWVLKRASFLNEYDDRYCYVGSRTFVEEGTANGQKAFQITACPNSVDNEPAKGTTAITYSEATSVYTAVAGFYILFTEADTGDELSMIRDASWGTPRSGYGRGGAGNSVDWALSLDSTLSTALGLTDSKGSTPKDGGNITIDFGRSLLEVIQTVCDQTECHWHVSPSGVVSIARKPNNLYTVPFGTDRTSGSSAIMLPLPLANSSQTKTSARDLRSIVFGSNSYLIDYSQDNDINTTHGRREGFYSNSGNDNEAVSNVASAGLKKAAGLTFGIDIDFIETTDRQAFIDFSVGDKILVEYKIGSYESRIVNGISVSISQDFQTSVQLTLESVIPDALVKLQNQSIYGTSQGSKLKAYLNSGNERVSAAVIRNTPVSSVEGMSNRVEVSWNTSRSANASGYDVNVYRTDSLQRVSAVSRTSNVATLTTPDAHGIQVGDLVNVTIATPLYSSFSATNAVVTAVNTSTLTNQTFSYSNTGTNVTGSLTDASTVEGAINIVSWARVNNKVTITTARAHGVSVGEKIIISDSGDTTVDAFKAVVLAVPSNTSLIYSNAGPDTTYTVGLTTMKLLKIVEFHSVNAAAYETSATVEGLAVSGRPYLTNVVSLNSRGEQSETTSSSPFFSSSDAMEVVGGAIKSPNYITGTSGWIIDSTGSAEFSNVVVRGAITGSTIDIGSGSNSFHVDINGNLWSGSADYSTATFRVANDGTVRTGYSATASFNIDKYGNTWIGDATFNFAPFRVTNLGIMTVIGANVSGTITASTINIGSGNTVFRVNTSGDIWSGNSAYASAPFKVYRDGTLYATSANITGAITATSGSIGSWSISSSSLINGTYGANAQYIELGASNGILTRRYVDGIWGSGFYTEVKINWSSTGAGIDVQGTASGSDLTTRIRSSFVDSSLIMGNRFTSSTGDNFINVDSGSGIRALGGAFFTTSASATARIHVAGSGNHVVAESSSLLKYKENIKDLDNALQKINLLRPRIYNYKIDAFEKVDPLTKEPWTEEATELNRLNIKYGLIVEEVLETSPELIVHTHGPITNEENKLEELLDMSTWEPYMWEDLDVLVLCIKAIQELSQKIDNIESKIN